MKEKKFSEIIAQVSATMISIMVMLLLAFKDKSTLRFGKNNEELKKIDLKGCIKCS